MSNFFAEFGFNTTTLVLSVELYPVNLRTTGHGLSAGIAKVGAFIGAFRFPTLEKALGLSGTLTIIAGFAALGFVLTFRLPEPSGRSLGYVSHEERSGRTFLALLSTMEQPRRGAAASANEAGRGRDSVTGGKRSDVVDEPAAHHRRRSRR